MYRRVALFVCVVFVTSVFSIITTSASEPILNSTPLEIRLMSNSASTMPDGSVVLAGIDPFSTFNDKTSSALMLCYAPTVSENKVLWQYEVNMGKGKYSFFSELDVLDDGSVYALLTVLDKESNSDRVLQQQSIVQIREGQVISEQPVANGVTKFKKTSEGMLTFTHDLSKQIEGNAVLSFIDTNNNLVWEEVLSEGITVSKLLAVEDSFYIIGSQASEVGGSARYVAKYGKNGDRLWERTEVSKNGSIWNDAAMTAEGNLVVAGGEFESGDASEAATAAVACYSSSGVLIWEDMVSFDALSFQWSSIVYTSKGLVLAGSNHVEPSTVAVSHYNLDGSLVFSWDEPVSQAIDSMEYIQLVNQASDTVFLVVTGDTGWMRSREQVNLGELRFLTLVHALNYLSPL